MSEQATPQTTSTAPLVIQCLECRRAFVKAEARVPANEHGWTYISHGYCPPCGAVKLAEVRNHGVVKEAA